MTSVSQELLLNIILVQQLLVFVAHKKSLHIPDQVKGNVNMVYPMKGKGFL